MGLGDVSDSVVPKPVLVSDGDDRTSVTSRYFTPHRCHTSHAVTGAIGVATAFALPGTVASTRGDLPPGTHDIAVLHPQGRIEVEVELGRATATRSACTQAVARPHRPQDPRRAISTCPTTSSPPLDPQRPPLRKDPAAAARRPAHHADRSDPGRRRQRRHRPRRSPDGSARSSAGPSSSTTAPARTARSPASTWPEPSPDGHTLLLGYVATHGMNPALQTPRLRPGHRLRARRAHRLLTRRCWSARPSGPGTNRRRSWSPGSQAEPDGATRYASAGDGTAPHFAAELFKLDAGVDIPGVTYEGSSAALSDTVARTDALMFASLFTAHPWITSGRLRALARRRPERVCRASRMCPRCTRPASTVSR